MMCDRKGEAKRRVPLRVKEKGGCEAALLKTQNKTENFAYASAAVMMDIW